MINYLLEAGAKKIYFTEINDKHIRRMKEEHPEVTFVKPEEVYGLDVDVFAPCALGAVLNDNTIPLIKAPIIAGTANNVLLEEDRHGNMVKDKGIVYAPDFVINAGGLINVYHELQGYSRDRVVAEVKLNLPSFIFFVKVKKS